MKKIETPAGKVFSEETRSVSRSLAASQAASTRARKRHEERESYLASHYRAGSLNSADACYGTFPVGGNTVAGVVDEIVETMEGMKAENDVAEDVAIWLGHRIVAVIRFGSDGKPTPTIF
jgi:hypothetical protein